MFRLCKENYDTLWIVTVFVGIGSSMRVSLQLAAVGLLLSSVALHAQSPGTWRVNGAISGRTFTLDCRLDQGAGQ
jgi:hypothetical protein